MQRDPAEALKDEKEDPECKRVSGAGKVLAGFAKCVTHAQCIAVTLGAVLLFVFALELELQPGAFPRLDGLEVGM